MKTEIEQLKTEIEKSKTERDALARWMQEVTDLLIYSPENPMDYKTGVVEAFATYRAAIGKPLRRDA
ncbi:MAG: hypothetical protein KGL39_43650 [Patescibacteria group bacterium]|nr:hypothetical protein [Patescibacteria group bacterium]